MDLIVAKWILTASLQLLAGTGLELPRLHLAQPSPALIGELIAIEDVWVPGVVCPPVKPGTVSDCVPTEGGFTRGAVHQSFCVDRGVYVVNLRLGMRPAGMWTADGRVWLATREGSQLLLEWANEPSRTTYQSGSAVVRAEAFTCVRLTYDSSGRAFVDPDPRVTSFTIHRAGG